LTPHAHIDCVAAIHERGIVHGDLKPGNFVLVSGRLKLIDFGIATTLEDGHLLYEVVGSRTYMAPEIDLRRGYGKSVDIYAVGVIMYILLCGYPPFDFDQGIYELAFGSPEWDEISQTAKDLISSLLDKDPAKRFTATQLKKNPWVSGGKAPQRTLTNNIHKTLSRYIEFNKFKTQMGGRNAKRMSIYGIFNIAHGEKPMSSMLVAPSIPEDEILMVSDPMSLASSLLSSTSSTSASKTASPRLPGSELDLLHTLNTDLAAHSQGFAHLKDRMVKLSDKTKSQLLKKQLLKTIEEVDFLSKEYANVVKQAEPVVKKAIGNKN